MHRYSPALKNGTPEPVLVLIVPTPHFLSSGYPFLIASVDTLAVSSHGPAKPLEDFLKSQFLGGHEFQTTSTGCVGTGV